MIESFCSVGLDPSNLHAIDQECTPLLSTHHECLFFLVARTISKAEIVILEKQQISILQQQIWQLKSGLI